MRRRDILRSGLLGSAAVFLPKSALAQDAPPSNGAEPAPAQPLTVGDSNAPFTFDQLSEIARQKAASAYAPTVHEMPEVVAALSYDEHRAIRYRPDHALWRADPVDFHLQAFYPGWVFKDLAEIWIGTGGVYERHSFAPSDFEYRPPLDPSAFENVQLDGVAGFRIHAPLERPDYYDELVTFLGASYFRGLGRGTRYGLSARGLAINTATTTPEEFPRFSAFFIERPQPGDRIVRLMALMESESLAGAFRFEIEPGQSTVMNVVERLYFRQPVERLGIAPLTSMYTFGENDRANVDDFRPEVHDSDGLFVERASGERLWRPLRNPEQLALSYFEETSPRAFGLLQRDRDFSHYADTEARYDIRPSLLIEPVGDWGRGVVELVEIPTDSEANDNIVAFWVPETRPEAGSEMEFAYRMKWGLHPAASDGRAAVASSFVGPGGNAVEADTSTRRFAIDFVGGTVSALPDGAEVQPVVAVSESAHNVHTSISRLPDGGWRVALELQKTAPQISEIRVQLSMLQRVVSETWLYQWATPDA